MAHQILENVSYDRDMQLHYIMELKHEMDKTSSMIYAEQKGRNEGEHNKALSIAKTMLDDNFSIEKIIKYTNLTKDQILV